MKTGIEKKPLLPPTAKTGLKESVRGTSQLHQADAAQLSTVYLLTDAVVNGLVPGE
jgi:hypothetical protein